MARAVTIARGLVGGLKQFISGNIPAYAEECGVPGDALIGEQCPAVAR